MLQELPLSSITCRDYLQQRTAGVIEDYSDSLRQMANLSSTMKEVKSALNNNGSIHVPLEIHEVYGEFLLVDGHHRYQGAMAFCKEAKVDIDHFKVPVKITPNSNEQAAISASFRANLSHGVRLAPSEIKQLCFRKNVWARTVPNIAAIKAETDCSQGTASKIRQAVIWCLEYIKTSGTNLTTPPMLKAFMTNKMREINIEFRYLDDYGLPSYSLLLKALKGDSYIPDEVDTPQKELNKKVAELISEIESKYGVEALREGLRRHKTNAYGIKITQHNKWKNEPETIALLAAKAEVIDF